MLDENFEIDPEASGALQTENPDVLGELAVTELSIRRNGYLYVYVNNNSEQPVFFDNLLISHTSSKLLEENNYYPFGMLWKAPTGDNKYKYNGKEIQTELDLFTEDYGARQYDPANGRWASVDPMVNKYQSWSPYNYTMNNPIKFIDPDGQKVVYANGVTANFKKAFGESVQYLNKNGAGGMLSKLEESDIVYYIGEASGGSSFSPKTNTILWDPFQALLTNELHELSPTSVLNHEVDHALQKDKNPQQQKTDGETPDSQYGENEEKRVIKGSEQKTAKRLGEIKEGEITRKDHGGTLYETTSTTSTKHKNEIIITPKKDEKDK